MVKVGGKYMPSLFLSCSWGFWGGVAQLKLVMGVGGLKIAAGGREVGAGDLERLLAHICLK